MATHKVSEGHLKRIESDWSRVARETVEIDRSILENEIRLDMKITAFGSEVACLRLYYAFKTGRVEFSKNLSRWFYTKGY